MKYKKQLKSLNNVLGFFLNETELARKKHKDNRNELFLIATDIHEAIKKIKGKG
jgi:hypothetical protein